MLRFKYHVRQEELRRFTQHRISARSKELNVAIEGPVVPQLQRDPYSGGDEDSPSDASRPSVAPWVCDRVNNPAGRAIHFLRRGASVFAQAINQGKQRCLTLP